MLWAGPVDYNVKEETFLWKTDWADWLEEIIESWSRVYGFQMKAREWE